MKVFASVREGDASIAKFRVLYASHSTKKRKVFHDGELRIHIDKSGSDKGTLLDDSLSSIHKFKNSLIASQILRDQPPFDICIGL